MTTLHDYQMSGEAARQFEFYALLMAAMRKADSLNFVKLASVFPEVAKTLQARYDAPGGMLEHELPKPENTEGE